MRNDPPPRRRTAIHTLRTLAAASAALLAAAIAVPALADPSAIASPSESASASASPSASDSASPSPSASTGRAPRRRRESVTRHPDPGVIRALDRGCRHDHHTRDNGAAPAIEHRCSRDTPGHEGSVDRRMHGIPGDRATAPHWTRRMRAGSASSVRPAATRRRNMQIPDAGEPVRAAAGRDHRPEGLGRNQPVAELPDCLPHHRSAQAQPLDVSDHTAPQPAGTDRSEQSTQQ